MGLDIYLLQPRPKLDIDLVDERGGVFPNNVKYFNVKNLPIFKHLQFEQIINAYWWENIFFIHDAEETEYEWVDTICVNYDNILIYSKPNGEKIKIITDNANSYLTIVNVIACDKIGYQRKGASPDFYTDHREDILIYSYKELYEIYTKYFSTIDSPGTNFLENILNVFVEGKHCVYFNW